MTSPAGATTERRVFIVDNGAYSIKAGWSPLNEPVSLPESALKAPSKKGSSSKARGKRAAAAVRQDDAVDSLEVAYAKLYEAKIYPNSIARSKVEKRTYVADELMDACQDFGGLLYRRPFERGMLTAWDVELAIWNRIFAAHGVDPASTTLLVTESYGQLPAIGEAFDRMVFEEWGFESYYRCPPASLIPYSGLFEQEDATTPIPECMIVVDIGYSYSHVVPIVDGKIVSEHCQRIDIGGKLLTNYLKQLVTFRQWDMMEETYVIDQVREDCCFVSTDWKKDMERARMVPSPLAQDYRLPDFSPGNFRGKIVKGPSAQEDEEEEPSGDAAATSAEHQILSMNNERFSVPELLFNPSDIGLNQAGLPEVIARVIASMDPDLQGMFWSNIGVIGGLAWTESLGERLDAELRALCPAEYEVALFEAADPTTEAFGAAQTLTFRPEFFEDFVVTRKEYEDYGSEICRRKFSTAHGSQYGASSPVAVDGDTSKSAIRGELKMRKSASKRKKGKKRKTLFDKADSDDALSGEDEEAVRVRRKTSSPPSNEE